MMTLTLTAIIHKEEDLYVAECPEVGTVSQGDSVEDAIANLKEATELYLEEFPLIRHEGVGVPPVALLQDPGQEEPERRRTLARCAGLIDHPLRVAAWPGHTFPRFAGFRRRVLC